ncbi:MAG TPA: phosphoenolpyruvate--protein phosphotransferase, partial [Verrucomicrobiae bacterium]
VATGEARLAAGLAAVLDAEAGLLLLDPPMAAQRYYALELARLADRENHINHTSQAPGTIQTGARFELAANAASTEEAERAFALGAESIGLFRSEMLFLDQPSPPDETAQLQIYQRLLKTAGGRMVIIRTLDAGGDKPLPYLHLPAEENPALGYRAIRIYREFETLFRTQLRALLRASASGPLRIMIPMVTTSDEARWVKNIFQEEKAHLSATGLPFNPATQLGAMIEVPAAAYALPVLGQEFDFFSIGSNDLLQYFAATDRADARLAHLYTPTNPAFLQLLKNIVDQAHAQQKWIGLCGEMAGQIRCLPLLLGLGLDEISVSANVLRDLKMELAAWQLAESRQLLLTALGCPSSRAVEALLAQPADRTPLALLTPDLVLLDAVAADKFEAIKLATDRLFVLGRTQQPRALERAVWEREQIGSTGFGHAFAIPHGKSGALRSNSLVLVKFKTPVAWDSLDGEPVKIMILVAIREADAHTQHMSILAKLARRVMDETFREELQQAADGTTICDYVNACIGASPRVRPAAAAAPSLREL